MPTNLQPGSTRIAGLSVASPSLGYAPSAPAASASTTVNPTGGGSTGGALAAGTYYLVCSGVSTDPACTWTTQEVSFTVAAGNIPSVTLPTPLPTAVNQYLPSISGSYNVYLGTSSNNEILYASGVTGTYNLTAAMPATGASPPTPTPMLQLFDSAGTDVTSSYSVTWDQASFGFWLYSYALPTTTGTTLLERRAAYVPSGISGNPGVIALAATEAVTTGIVLGGSGPSQVSITVVDSNGNKLNNAIVSLMSNQTPYLALSGANGVAIINVPDGSYTVSASLAGYQSGAPSTLIVSGTTSVTLTLSAVGNIIISEPSTCACYGMAYLPGGEPQPGMQVTFYFLSAPSGSPAGVIFNSSPVVATSNSAGQLSTSAGNFVTLYQGATYSASIGNSVALASWVCPSTSAATLPAIVGTP